MSTSTDLAVSHGKDGNQRPRPGKTPPAAAIDDVEPDDSPALPPRITTSEIMASPAAARLGRPRLSRQRAHRARRRRIRPSSRGSAGSPRRLICGELSIRVEANPSRLVATYVENLPTGQIPVEGPVGTSQRTLNLDLRHADRDARFGITLFRPALPASILAGYLSGAAAAAKKLGVAADTVHVPQAYPAEAIVELAKARDCGLIVMASHGRRGLRKLVLGSQTSEVLAHSPVPVLVVR